MGIQEILESIQRQVLWARYTNNVDSTYMLKVVEIKKKDKKIALSVILTNYCIQKESYRGN